nr:MAG TPA: hypothetical protein [Caudoviricetes sp.]
MIDYVVFLKQAIKKEIFFISLYFCFSKCIYKNLFPNHQQCRFHL